MANRKMALIRRCKTPSGWRRYPVAMSANGRVKPDAVLVAGVEQIYPQGHYEIRRFEGIEAVYDRVDGNASDALAALRSAQKRSNVVFLAADAGVEVVPSSTRMVLRERAPAFIAAARDRGSVEAAEVYGLALDEFLAGCQKVYADELTREDISRFHKALKARGMSARTVHNRHQSIRAFILSMKLDVKEIVGKAPKFEKTMPEIYEPSELSAFFASLTAAYDLLFFDLLLQTGLREREAMHLEWRDISWSRHTLKVESKPAWKHRIKDSEERELPLSDSLLRQLSAFRLQHPELHLVFGKRGGTVDAPDGHLLRRLKKAVRDAGLNCNRCASCLDTGDCSDWFLHRFRATFCTTLLRSGMDLRTVQRLMGHSDMESTMRYLRPAGNIEVQARVNAISWR